MLVLLSLVYLLISLRIIILTSNHRNGKRNCRNSRSLNCRGILHHRHRRNRCHQRRVTENHHPSQPHCLAMQCRHPQPPILTATKDLESSRNQEPIQTSLFQLTVIPCHYLKALRMVVAAVISRDNVLHFIFNSNTGLVLVHRSTNYNKGLPEFRHKVSLSRSP